MLDSMLEKKSLSFKVTVKTLISVLFIVLAIFLPQIFHLIGGAPMGSVYLPMYLPVLLAGLLLGWKWGLGIGILAPISSFAFTSFALDSAMPTLSRLPIMAIELAIFGLVSGLFSKKVLKNPLFSFVAVFSAQISGRLINFLLSLISGMSAQASLEVIKTGLPGLYLQAFLVPLIAIVLAKAIKENK